MQANILQITKQTGTGTQDFTGFGFDPIFMIGSGGPHGLIPQIRDDQHYNVGMYVSPVPVDDKARGTGGGARHNTTQHNAAAGYQPNLFTEGTWSSVESEGELSALITDGVRVDWVTNNGAAREYFLLGAPTDDTFKVEWVEANEPGSTGEQTYTASTLSNITGMLYWAARTTGRPPSGGFVLQQQPMGICDSSLNQHSMFSYYQSTNDSKRRQTADRIHRTEGPGAATWIAEAEVTAVSGNQVTFDWKAVTGTAYQGNLLCFEAPAASVVVQTVPTTATTQSLAIPGIDPKLMLLYSWNRAASTDLESEGHIAYSFATSATNRFSFWSARDDTANEYSGSHQHDAKVFSSYDPGSSHTLKAQADIDTWGPGEIIFDWTTVDGTAIEYFALVMGDAVATGSGLWGQNEEWF